MTRVARAGLWLAPVAFCLILYWAGLKSWFSEDDFAWLNLRNHVIDFHSFLWAMFAPLAQGTVRPLSERAFFMVFTYFFGLHALPYHIFVFLNQFVNIALLIAITRKLTKSDVAAFLAPLLWLANVAQVTPIAWTSAYNEVQCASFILVGFYLFLRYTETGRRGFYWAQWATFLLGFGANEINLVYPALAALYAILFARRYWLSTLPMFAVSAAYALLHRIVTGASPGFYYDMDFHPGWLFRAVWQYWKILVAVPEFGQFQHWPLWIQTTAVLIFAAAIPGFIAWQARQRRFLPLFLLGWFLIALAPLLPLHNHVTDYYLFIPALGMAMLAAQAMALAFRRAPAGILAAAVALLYLVPSTIQAHRNTADIFDRGDLARFLVQSVAYAKHIHPGKTILLNNVDDALFWTAVYGAPFHILGWADVFMTPDCVPLIKADPHLLATLDAFVLPAGAVAHALQDGSAVVYNVENRRLRNITRSYTALIQSEPAPALAPSIDVGAPYYKSQVGDGWYGFEGGFRWSRQHAVVYLKGPSAPGQKLTVQGFAPEQQIKAGPLHFALTIDGRKLPVQMIGPDNAQFHFQYDLPADFVGRPKLEVAFTIDRTFRVATDDRDLGLAFGAFSIQ